MINNKNNNRLIDLANKYNSDKGTLYKCAHNYAIIYEEIIKKILYNYISNKNPNKIDLLEIGLNRDDSLNIPSLMMWNEYFYKNVNITGFDINNDFLNFKNLYKNIHIIIGDQQVESDLKKLQYKKYDIIIDDGYHASKHQQISFKKLWHNIKSNGYYIIEDLHFQPVEEYCLKTKKLFENWKNNNWIDSEYISNEEIQYFKNTIESINFYDSQSQLWSEDSIKNSFVYIKKK